MPVVYGEGEENAFLRLQEEINKKSDDHSLFAWKLPKPDYSHGLLAPHPSIFADSHHITRASGLGPRPAWSLANIGVRIELPLVCPLQGGLHTAELKCRDARTGLTVGINLMNQDDGTFLRLELDCFVAVPMGKIRNNRKSSIAQVVHNPHQSLAETSKAQQFRSKVLEDKEYSRTELFLETAAAVSGKISAKGYINLPR